jgi:DnaJ homolog subfamily C member 1
VGYSSRAEPPAFLSTFFLYSPDKNPGVKGIHERFARLGVISNILRDGEKRKRYDFFYKNGVPKWRGTGYYYDRFRPGLGVRSKPNTISNYFL